MFYYNFDLSVSNLNSSHIDKMTYLEFLIKREHSFIQNIFSVEDLSEKINTIESKLYVF